MDSYVTAPEIHAEAATNRRLLGGPFIDYGGQRVDEIASLRDHTKTACRHLVELSRMISELDGLLRAEARGYSLQSLYPRVPDGLRGYVELVYDLNNHPAFRLFESLLYKSRYYDSSLQSIMISEETSDDRPFVLSTPRLACAAALHWRIPFSDPALDTFFELKSTASELTTIMALVGAGASDEALVRSFLTPRPPPVYRPYCGPNGRWRYFGHACVLVETQGVSILFDPVLSYTYESAVSRYTYLDLPDVIDYVCITHNHQDHILIETLLQIRHKVRHVIVPRGGGSLQDPSLKLLLQAIGFTNIIELDVMEKVGDATVSITALPFLGEHCDLDVRTKSAYLVRVGARSLLFASDSCNIEPVLYDHIVRETGEAEVLFLGMECVGAPLTWLYGPLLTSKLDKQMDQSRRLAGSNYEQAIRMVERCGCREVYVYAMGQEPWLNHVMSLKYTEQSRPIVESDRLVRECQTRGMVAERLFGEKEMFLASG